MRQFDKVTGTGAGDAGEGKTRKVLVKCTLVTDAIYLSLVLLLTSVKARLRYSRLPKEPPLRSCDTSTSVELIGIVSLRGPPFIR